MEQQSEGSSQRVELQTEGGSAVRVRQTEGVAAGRRLKQSEGRAEVKGWSSGQRV